MLCSINCDFAGTGSTNPAEIREGFYIAIPAFARTTLGKRTGSTEFSTNGMIVGKNTQIFTLADTINFEYSNPYGIAKTLED